MYCVQTNTLHLGGSGIHSTPPPIQFYVEDIEELYARGATDGRLANAINLQDNKGIVACFGLTSVGAEMGYAALPCPPYCVEGKQRVLLNHVIKTVKPTSFKKRSNLQQTTFFEALKYLKSGRWPRPKKVDTSVQIQK